MRASLIERRKIRISITVIKIEILPVRISRSALAKGFLASF